MANAWRRDKPSPFLSIKFLLLLLIPISLLIFLFPFSQNPTNPSSLITPHLKTLTLASSSKVPPFDCLSSPQASPVVASLVEGVRHPFLFSLSDFGTLPDKPHKNIQRILKGKAFRRPDISVTVQEILEKRKGEGGDGVVVDVGANVGMATFAAAAMGFRVVAFEPVFENLQRVCDGVFLNRAWERVAVFHAAASDRIGNITIHKVLKVLLVIWQFKLKDIVWVCLLLLMQIIRESELMKISLEIEVLLVLKQFSRIVTVWEFSRMQLLRKC